MPLYFSCFLRLALAAGLSHAAALRADGELLLNAEDAHRTGSVALATSPGGYQGSGYLTGFTNSRANAAVWTFEAAAGLYEVELGFATPSGPKGYGLWHNGAANHGMFPDTGGAWAVHPAGTLLLTEGTNTIEIGAEWGWYWIDFLRLRPRVAELPPEPPRELVNPRASEAARNLQAYLVDLFGRKMLAGQQSLRDVQWIYEVTGKMPALGAFDFMDYSPSRVERGTNPEGGLENSENWIAWEREHGGIVTLMWHWNAPAGLYYPDPPTPQQIWWRGFYTMATTFDLAEALADPEGEHYQLLLRDMDAIAEELKKFRDAGIPVLWRPLHEAAGAWFWWGAAGKDAFIELWRLMFDRYTHHHDLNHLIWVYTHEIGHADWYPGDDYVDIVGVDIYTEHGSSMSSQWDEMMTLFGGRKLVALAETGTLPVPDLVRTFGTWWSWFCPWSGEFTRGQDPDFVRSVYDDPDVLTADELADWRHRTPSLRNVRVVEGRAVFDYRLTPPFAYELEVSVDGKSWQKLTFPAGNGEAVKLYWPRQVENLAELEVVPPSPDPVRLFRLTEHRGREVEGE
ncbi:MAG: mannan endo-1,4-beta-mannosidase [Puniceicoccaceae bacterium]|nr:MAG: mannan endo-1,4-beta-mannosidase [Puniceicoccaceae bacterium]